MALLSITSNLTHPKRAAQQRLSWEVTCPSICPTSRNALGTSRSGGDACVLPFLEHSSSWDKEAWGNIAYLIQISRDASSYLDPLQEEIREIT